MVSQVPLIKSLNIYSCMTPPIKKMTPPNFSKFGKDFFLLDIQMDKYQMWASAKN